MTLVEKMKKARINKNFTQEYLAEILSVSQKTYSNFENDKSKPGFSQVEEMAKVLDVSVLDFLSGDSITVNQSDNKVAIAQNYAAINNPEKLIEQYEERIKELKEQLEYWKNKSEGNK